MRLALAALLLAAAPAAALDLRLTNTYDLARPASLDYDPTFCGLWIANESRELVLVTLDGLELRRFSSDLRRIKAVTLEGDNLLIADGFGGFQRVTKDGTALGPPFEVEGGWADTEGIAIGEDGTIITVEDDPERLTWFTPEGEILRQIDTKDLDPPLIEAQGIARDPRTGHLLIVDDLEGTNSLYEFTEDGELLATQSLLEYGLDPEGIAIRPGSGEMFIAFDQGARIAAFEYTPTLPEGAAPLPPGADCMMF
ncbi:MAG: hypothetical protein QNJ13_07235 [Paracoccaceae bacterium]|nr:hypothetical protein [Paracoccaceae bacterium]